MNLKNLPSWLSKGTVWITVLVDKVHMLTMPMPMQCPSFTSLPVASKSPLGWNLIKMTDWPSWPQSSWSCLNCPSLSLQMATPPSTCPTAMMSFVMSTSLTLQGWGRIWWFKKRVRTRKNHQYIKKTNRISRWKSYFVLWI